MQDGWIGLAWLAVPWYPVAVHHAGWVDWAGLVSSALVSSGSPPCRMGGLVRSWWGIDLCVGVWVCSYWALAWEVLA